MFCVQCGNQLEEDAKFCAKCGNSVNGGAHELFRVIQPVAAWITHKKNARVLAALISIFIITTLFLDWVSILIRPSSFVPKDNYISDYLPKEINNMLHTDIYLTITTHDLNKYARGLKSISNMLGTSGMVPAQVTSAIKSATDRLHGSAGFIRFISMICVLSFAVFLSLMIGNSKKAGLAGQTATLLTFLFSLVFAISVSVINSRLPAIVSQGINVNTCGSVYVTMIMSAVGFLLITVCKRAINEE